MIRRQAIATENLLRRTLGPAVLPKPAEPAKATPKPPRRPLSEVRIPQIKANIELGLELLALREKAKWNCTFGRMVHAKGIGKHASDVSAIMQVARVYANRPEIFTKLSWGALVALASSTMPAAVRQGLEPKILSGRPVKGPEIAHACAGTVMRSGRPKRPADQSAPRMAE